MSGGLTQMDANVRFGALMHKLVKQYVMFNILQGDLSTVFSDEWIKYRHWDLTYPDGYDWDRYLFVGEALCRAFERSWMEKQFLPFFAETRVGSMQPDLLLDLGGKIAVVDIKVSEKAWSQQDVDNSQQLTDYAYAVHVHMREDYPIAVMVCNFVKSTQSVLWITSKREAE